MKIYKSFIFFHVMPESLCRKTDTAGHFCNVELRLILQNEFIQYGMELKHNNKLKDHSKKSYTNIFLKIIFLFLEKNGSECIESTD